MANDTESTNMPPEVAALLEAKRTILIVNGVVQCRCEKDRAQTWRLRFREHDKESGYRVHRSIGLGGEAVAKAVMATLDKWRADHQEQSEEAAVNEKRKCAENAYLRALAIFSAGKSRDQRRQIGWDFDAAASKGVFELWMFAMRLPYAYPKPKRGRPRRTGLW